MESRSSLLFGPSLEPLYYCTSVSVREKPSSYSIHSPQFVVFSVVDQFLDLDLRHNIFNPIQSSNKKSTLGCLFWFHIWISHPSIFRKKPVCQQTLTFILSGSK